MNVENGISYSTSKITWGLGVRPEAREANFSEVVLVFLTSSVGWVEGAGSDVGDTVTNATVALEATTGPQVMSEAEEE